VAAANDSAIALYSRQGFVGVEFSDDVAKRAMVKDLGADAVRSNGV
jgi:ribosomal protein S18 acetylase RimI-like enzyme